MPESSSQVNTPTNPSALETKFVTLQRWNNFTRLQTVATALVVAGLFGNFAYRTYNDVTSGFSAERTQRAVEDAIPVIAPPVGKVLKDTLAEVLPEYRKQVAARYEGVRTKLTDNATAKLSGLPEKSGRLLSDSLTRAFERAVARIGPDVAKDFPSLADPEKRALLATQIHDVIEAHNIELAKKVEAIGVTEATRMHGILEKFDVATAADGRTDDELQRDMIRTLMRLTEAELEKSAGQTTTPAPRATASNDGY